MTQGVAERSSANQAMLDASAKGRALMGGTTAMRAAGNTYLPKFEAESPKGYKARLDSSWLFNGYRKTVRDMTGRVFDSPVVLGDNAPDELVNWTQDIDKQGRDLSTFARKVFQDALAGSGIAYIMVDAPVREGTTTKAQAQAKNLRPYMVHLRIEDLIHVTPMTVNNVQVLGQARIFETITEQDPEDEFKTIEIEQIRVLDRGEVSVRVRVFRKASDKKWEQFGEEGNTGLSEITIIPFYANQSGFFVGEPLLDDLADVNIAHWQSQSDQRNILHAARVPILHATGRTTDDKAIVIGSNTAVTASDPTAKLEWVEHTGKAIEAGRTDLKDLEFQMETHGLQLVADASGQSATGEAVDAAKETSTLSMTADELQDAFEQAMLWMMEYGGISGEANVVVNKEFSVSHITAQELQVMLTAVNTGNMSKQTFLAELVRRGVIADDIDVLDEIERIEEEGGDLDDDTDGDE